MPDKELVEKARGGDQGAFEQLVLDNQNKVYSLALRLVLPFVPTQLYKILPYVVTVIVLIVSSMRNNKEKQPPASLGLAYFREDR